MKPKKSSLDFLRTCLGNIGVETVCQWDGYRVNKLNRGDSMEFTHSQRWIVFQAIEEKLFKLYFHIRDLEKMEQTKEMIYHIGNLKKDQEELRTVRKKMQM
jgi:hypothetical protein